MNWIHEFFTRNVGLKMLSLVLAFLVWMAIASDPITEASFRVPIEFVNVPPKSEVLTDQPDVRLWARGPSRAVRRATASDFAVRVDVGGVIAHNEASYALALKEVSAPSPLEVKEVTPDQVTVTLDQTSTKEVPIRPRFYGELPPGYRLKSFDISPPIATIVGPATHLDAITAASTVILDLAKLAQGETLTASVAISDPRVRFVQPQSVRIKVELEKAEASAPSGTAGKAPTK